MTTIINTPTTTSTFTLPTPVSEVLNTITNLSSTNKILLGVGAGVVLITIGGLITYLCCRRYQVVRVREGMQISYPLTPVSPGLRRRR